MSAEILGILGGGLALGVLHAFEVDHLAAVSTFVSRRPKPLQATLFGVKWALGHSLSLLVLGSALYLLKSAASYTAETSWLPAGQWLEHLVGAALVALGLWTLLKLRPGQIHHSHDHHPDDAADPHGHPHPHGSLLMGMLHGAAGTAAFVMESLVILAGTYALALAYTAAFSLGILIAMAAYAGLLGGVISWSDRRFAFAARGAQAVAGICACGVGITWLIR